VISGGIGVGGVGDISRERCSAGCTGAVAGGGDGVWLARIFWVGGVSARCEEACRTSSVLLLGSREDKTRDCRPEAILNLEVVSPPANLGFDGRAGIFEVGRLKAAALIRPLTVGEGSPPAGLLLASLLLIGVGIVEEGEPETGENWLAGEKILEGDDAWPT